MVESKDFNMSYISNAMGWILSKLSSLCGYNFAVSVFVFTLLVNLLMLPLTLKSQKSTAKQAKLKPKLDALKKKYGDDRQKYSVAMQELYNKEGVSMGGGCLPMIIRLVIMMGVYWAVASPLTYVVNIDKAAVDSAVKWTKYVSVVEDDSASVSDAEWEMLGLSSRVQSDDVITMTEKYNNNHDTAYYAKLSIIDEVVSSDKKFEDGTTEKKIVDLATKVTGRDSQKEVEIANYIVEGNADFEPIVKDKFVENGGDVSKLDKIDFTMFGINLTQTPDFSWNFSKFQSSWIIPIISFLSAMASSIVSMIIQKKANPDAPNMAFMMLTMPLFSLYIAFKVPGAVGFYWACSSAISGVLQVLTQTLYGPNVVIAKEQSKSIVERVKVEQAIISKIDTADGITDKE